MVLYKKITFICILLLSQRDAKGSQLKNIQPSSQKLEMLTLEVGQTIFIESAIESDLHISNKGIIYAFNLNPTRWNIVALKKGSVIVKTESNHWLINVLPKSKKINVNNFANFPKWICDIKTIQCEHNYGTIKGSFESIAAFTRTKTWCKENNPCLFLATLSRQSKQELYSLIESRLPKNFTFDISDYGDIFLLNNCQHNKVNLDEQKNIKSIEKLLPELHRAITITNSCKDVSNNYILKATTILIHDTDIQSTGLNSTKGLKLSQTFNLMQNFMNQELQLLLNNNKATIIGQPTIKMVENEMITLNNGGEIAIESTSDSTKGLSHTWKQYGFKLEACINSMTQDQVLAHLSVSLSQPSQKAKQVMQSNYINTKTVISLGSDTTVGSIKLTSDQKNHSRNSILNDIPLISPIFTSKTEEHGNAFIFFNVLITKENDS